MERSVRLPSLVSHPASLAYAAVARRLRARGRRRARRLRRPVISVGNISVGGSGKTPLVACIAGMLRELGERPAILSRGYGRARPLDGVVVVSDGHSVLADLDRSGDEPLWLARNLPGVSVLVSSDRRLAGTLAESRLGCTVHLLDDGFQHHALRRDADVVIASAADLAGRPLPAGRLRESLDALADADAIVVPARDDVSSVALATLSRGAAVFAMTRALGVPRSAEPWGAPPRVPRDAPAVAIAGIARPTQFFDALTADGWRLVGTKAFADHHRFTGEDVAGVRALARASGAVQVVTTEKDLMRLLPLRPLPFQLACVPLHVTVSPEDRFLEWIRGRLLLTRAQSADSVASDRRVMVTAS